MNRLILTGADGASYEAATRAVARVMSFPDGIARHITLTAWEWQVFDWLEASGRFGPRELAVSNYNSAARQAPGWVLRAAKPLGWQRRPVVAFNDAAGHTPAGIWALRENFEDMTGQGQRAFEEAIRDHLRCALSCWKYNRMGFDLLDTANDFMSGGPAMKALRVETPPA